MDIRLKREYLASGVMVLVDPTKEPDVRRPEGARVIATIANHGTCQTCGSSYNKSHCWGTFLPHKARTKSELL